MNKIIVNDLIIEENELENFVGLPYMEVRDDLMFSWNDKLKSLEGLPKKIGKTIYANPSPIKLSEMINYFEDFNRIYFGATNLDPKTKKYNPLYSGRYILMYDEVYYQNFSKQFMGSMNLEEYIRDYE